MQQSHADLKAMRNGEELIIDNEFIKVNDRIYSTKGDGKLKFKPISGPGINRNEYAAFKILKINKGDLDKAMLQLKMQFKQNPEAAKKAIEVYKEIFK
ncbi:MULTISPECIES: hypothetical protein [Acinetobacter]|uniref:Uncharacterized protein n=1 Tax=Acinetobacter piscicola TaxID=2006115 RepID=A0A7S7AI71_9GAMM|nr:MULTISPECIES: hypothetical protein [Acinetobacter]QOW46699.1 hypothetical protein G0028_12765 [Acinetobacter piscicola]